MVCTEAKLLDLNALSYISSKHSFRAVNLVENWIFAVIKRNEKGKERADSFVESQFVRRSNE